MYVEKHGEDGILEKTTDGYVLRQANGNYKKFDKAGYLISLGDTEGDHTFLYYEKKVDGKPLLSRVRTNGGNILDFSYIEDGANKGLVNRVTDQSGRSVYYTYDAGKLTEIAYSDGCTRVFTYTDDNRIKDVINTKGVSIVSNEYDNRGRIVKQSFPNESFMRYEYDDNRRTITAIEQNKNKVIYTHDYLGHRHDFALRACDWASRCVPHVARCHGCQ